MTAIAVIPYLVFYVLAAIQRTHDMDWSAWMLLLALIPFVALIWVFKPGTRGANRFGAPPPPNGLGVKIGGLDLPGGCSWSACWPRSRCRPIRRTRSAPRRRSSSSPDQT